jgi:hypothetical protein
MALKGKTRGGSRHSTRTIARPPRAVLERKPRKRRIRLDAITILGGLFVLTMSVVVGWAVYTATRPEKIEGLDGYKANAKKPVADLNDVDESLKKGTADVIAGKPEGDAAITGASQLAEKADAAATKLRTGKPTGELAMTAQLHVNAANTLTEAARVLGLAAQTTDPALRAQIAKNAERLRLLGAASLNAGSGSLRAIEDRNPYRAPAGIVPIFAGTDLASGPPLDGIVNDPGPPQLSSTKGTQSDKAFAKATKKHVDAFFMKISTMGEAVAAFEADRAPDPLRQKATEWYTASADLAKQLAAEKRPQDLQAAYVAYRNAAWLYQESARAFASAGVQPGLADGLLAAGKRLRLAADELVEVAGGTLNRATKIRPGQPPASQFDPTLLDPSAAAAGATGATGAVPTGTTGAVPTGATGVVEVPVG